MSEDIIMKPIMAIKMGPNQSKKLTLYPKTIQIPETPIMPAKGEDVSKEYLLRISVFITETNYVIGKREDFS